MKNETLTYEERHPSFAQLLGKTLVKAENIGSEQIHFITKEGEEYKLHHESECCESVLIDDICGDLSDLVGSPILQSEEATSDKNPEGVQKEYQDSFTWTFYRMATNKGSVVIRWYGESNGYYSESVTFERIK